MERWRDCSSSYPYRRAAGALASKTVNIKTYSRHEYVLDISSHPCD
jgi:hypothetical protein